MHTANPNTGIIAGLLHEQEVHARQNKKTQEKIGGKKQEHRST